MNNGCTKFCQAGKNGNLNVWTMILGGSLAQSCMTFFVLSNFRSAQAINNSRSLVFIAVFKVQ